MFGQTTVVVHLFSLLGLHQLRGLTLGAVKLRVVGVEPTTNLFYAVQIISETLPLSYTHMLGQLSISLRCSCHTLLFISLWNILSIYYRLQLSVSYLKPFSHMLGWCLLIVSDRCETSGNFISSIIYRVVELIQANRFEDAHLKWHVWTIGSVNSHIFNLTI